MDLLNSLNNHRTARGLSLRATALALLLTVTLTAARATVTVSAPPSYPDTAHVLNGCHLSTITFLARFQAEFPGERGEPLVITMMNADGIKRRHTIALISWQGQSWCRDEYFGVFALNCAADAQPNLARLADKAERLLEKHAQELLRTGAADPRPEPPSDMSREQRLRDVTVAAKMIPFPATIFWVHSGNRDLPLAFFRPAGQKIAVYDPLHGTCLADCSISDDAKVVSLAATKLGYHVDGIRPDLSNLRGTLVAASEMPVAGFSK